MLKVALVGCGQIADAHLEQIRRIGSASLVAVCDREIDLARQAGARYGVAGIFDDLDTMIKRAAPDVLHVTTPPQSHHTIALAALASGLHVYIEKPFTVDSAQAAGIISAARLRGRLVCVGHDHLFDPVWQECMRLVDQGLLGRIVHVDSVMGYDLSGPFGKVFLGDPGHWIHRLPGKLFHNTVSHGLYKITEFLHDEHPRIMGTWFGSSRPGGFPTELRILLQVRDVTASLLFMSEARPVQRVVRLYGTKQSIEVDWESRSIRHQRRPALRGPFIKIEVPMRHMKEAAGQSLRNIWAFLRNDLNYFEGMHRLIGKFYEAILENKEPPIAYGQILKVTAILDEIFAHCLEQTSNSSQPASSNGKLTSDRTAGETASIAKGEGA